MKSPLAFLAVASLLLMGVGPSPSPSIAPIARFTVTTGKIDFYANAKPSMLKVHGESSELSGYLTQQKSSFSGAFKSSNTAFTTGMKIRDSHLKSKVFQSDQFPVSELSFQGLELKSGEKVPFTALLKLHGIEKEVKGEVKSTHSDQEVQFQANLQILLSDFAIAPPEYMGMSMENQVKIEVTATAKKQ